MAFDRSKIFNADVGFAFGMGAILCVLLFPMPKLVLDMLLVVNVSFAFFILVLMFYLRNPLEFSSFPAMLLVLTLYRLSLNVASTKLILLEANAGNVIDAFGRFVVQNNYVIGTVVFAILMVIQFMVITKGAGRIAEVAARFTLDALPGKQMSIDADLNAGIIDEDEARERREKLSQETEFYGAMDGASKFIRGDNVAGIIITAINVLGGLAIGVLQRGMPVTAALQRYIILTIGDGLVTQIPALVIGIAAGMLVTKTSGEGGIGQKASDELLRRPEPLYISSIFLIFLGIMPAFPFLPFAMVSAVCFAIARQLSKKIALAGGAAAAGSGGKGRRAANAAAKALGGGGARQLGGGRQSGSGNAESAPGDDSSNGSSSSGSSNKTLPLVNPMTLEIGFSLVPLVDQALGGDLVDRIGLIRDQIREELGLLIPPISIQDNIELGNSEYRILVRGLERARGNVHVGSHMAINPGDASGQIEGVRAKDPAFGFDAVWISSSRVEHAEMLGYTVVDAASVVTTHVTKVVRDYADDLLSRQDVHNMLELVRATDEAVVNELVPNRLSVGVIHRILQYLLHENVPIHDFPTMLETMSDYAAQTKDPVILSEFVRQALKGHIIAQYLGDDGSLAALVLHPSLEEELQRALNQSNSGSMLSLAPQQAAALVEQIEEHVGQVRAAIDNDLVLLVSPTVRLHIRRLVERKLPDLPVLSYAEVDDDVNLQVLATVRSATAVEEALSR